jgi:hypothetical protein
MDQTAVEWFFENLNSHKIEANANELFEQAKQMEKEQRKQDVINAWNSAAGGDAFSNAEQYYTSTFKSE